GEADTVESDTGRPATTKTLANRKTQMDQHKGSPGWRFSRSFFCAAACPQARERPGPRGDGHRPRLGKLRRREFAAPHLCLAERRGAPADSLSPPAAITLKRNRPKRVRLRFRGEQQPTRCKLAAQPRHRLGIDLQPRQPLHPYYDIETAVAQFVIALIGRIPARARAGT